MWPWEHLAVGYVAYSGLVRAGRGRPPRGAEAVAVAIGTQFPDLIDKPLAWGLEVLPSGRSLAHSLLFAVPLILLVLAVAVAVRRLDVGTAFGVGYLSHLPADVVYPMLQGEGAAPGFLLWPVTGGGDASYPGFFSHLREALAEFATAAVTPGGAALIALDASLVLFALGVWVLDGTPGLRWLRRDGGPDRTEPEDELF